MIIDESITQKTRSFAAAGNTPRQIAHLLQLSPTDRELFVVECSMTGSKVNEAYMAGVNIAAHNRNVELTKKCEKGDIDAIQAFAERKYEQEVADLKMELFGV